MECKNCGVVNVDDARFCKSCGADLEEVSSKDVTEISGKTDAAQFILKNRFRIVRPLGRGGMGEVLLAEDIKLQRKVAIKRVLSHTMNDPTWKARFLREAQTASRLDHSNVCTIYEIDQEDDHEYIVMQYVDGVTLDHIIRMKRLSITKILDIAIQLCSGMIEAHSHDIIHRDIKPGNIIVDRRGVVKILDFGLAKFRDETLVKDDGEIHSNLTEKGIVLGTVCYLSPEQASGKPLDQRTDIFSFGILLYEMLEAKNPFKKDEQIETLYNVLNKEIHFDRPIPIELERIIRKTVEKEKDKRYHDFVQLKEDLETFRVNYLKSKENHEPMPGTEVLDTREQDRLAREIQKSSDQEELGDLVYRIKRFKAYTEPIVSSKTRAKQITRVTLWILLLILAGVTGYYIKDNFLDRNQEVIPVAKKSEKFYIYLEPFENKTNVRDLSQKVNYLLSQSLNQFDPFKVISEEEAKSILGVKKNTEIDIKKIADKFNVKYVISGAITNVGSSYTIDGSLTPLDKTQEAYPLTVAGKKIDSFLGHQVDSLTKRIYRIFARDKGYHDFDLKKIANIYGTDWKTFSNFYLGYLYKNRMESAKARKYLLEAGDLPIAQYYLADLFYFSGDRQKALNRIKVVIPQIRFLTGPQKYRVLALQARLEVNFKKEIKNREKLKDDFEYSKEAFLELGEAYFHYANAEKGLEYFKKALDLDKNYSNALNRMGYCYSYLGEHASAIDAFENYRVLDETANSYDSLGDGYFYAGDLTQSEAMKEMAIASDEKSVYWAYLTIGDINILKAKYEATEAALNAYLKAVSSLKDKASVLDKKAYLHYLKGESLKLGQLKSENKDDERRNTEERNAEYRSALATIQQSLKMYDSWAINDNTAEAHWLKAIIYLAMGEDDQTRIQKDELEEHLIKKYHLSKDNFQQPLKYFIHLEALTAEKDGDIEEAERLFKRLMDMKTRLSYWITYYNYQFFHTEYVKFLVRNDKYQQALEEVDKCLHYNANYIPALWEKAKLLERTGSMERNAVYDKIKELYGPSEEKNRLRDLLKDRYK